MSNLKLWDSVSKTDPAFTKKGQKGAHHFTSVAPMYQIRKATEAFGPQGLGWGIDPASERFSEREYGTTIILSYDAILFFKLNDERGEIPIHASEKSCYQTRGAGGYMKIDDEVRKKVVTNAKTKGLSELGICADIFLGQFDDPNYVDFRNLEEGIEKAEDRNEEITKKILELNEWCRKEIATYPSIKAKSTLGLVCAKHKQNVAGRCDLLGLNREKYFAQFDLAYNTQLTAIQETKDAK